MLTYKVPVKQAVTMQHCDKMLLIMIYIYTLTAKVVHAVN